MRALLRINRPYMLPKIQNLFHSTDPTKDETITELMTGGSFKLEHIVSRGNSSPTDFWYAQATDEWVALIAGQASIRFEEGVLDLIAGDALFIPAKLRHQVSKTSPDAVWIALHRTPRA